MSLAISVAAATSQKTVSNEEEVPRICGIRQGLRAVGDRVFQEYGVLVPPGIDTADDRVGVAGHCRDRRRGCPCGAVMKRKPAALRNIGIVLPPACGTAGSRVRGAGESLRRALRMR